MTVNTPDVKELLPRQRSSSWTTRPKTSSCWANCLAALQRAGSQLANAPCAPPTDSRPDLILLDVMMPGMDGYDMKRMLLSDLLKH